MRALGLSLAMMPLLVLPVRAQAYIMTSSIKEPETWSDWKASLRRRDQPAWVVVEDPAKPLLPALTAALKVEPLLETDFQVISAGLDGPLGRDIRSAFAWEGPHWALVNAHGVLLLSGTRVPTPSELSEQMRIAGVKSRVEQLLAFTVRYPDHLEAREALLSARLALARRRMAPLVKVPDKQPGEEASPQPILLAPLSGEEDARIWGTLASELERHLLSGDFLKTAGWGLVSLDQGAPVLSPAMQGMALKCLPIVEEALRQAPGRYEVWNWWMRLAVLAGGRPLRPLLDSLVQVPGDASNEFPPKHVLSQYLRGAKRAGRWSLIKDLLVPRWEVEQLATNRVVGMDANGKALEDGLGLHWDSFLGMLLEAHLRLGETQAADQLVNEINAWQPGSTSLPRRASAVATACGFPDLAVRWSALKVIPKS